MTNRCEFDGTHGAARSVELEPDEEFKSTYGETCHSDFCHWRGFGDIRRIEYSFCHNNFIQRNSEYEVASNIKSSSRG